MKKISSLLTIVVFFCLHGNAQDSLPEKNRTYSATVQSLHGTTQKGWLANIKDTSLYLANYPINLSPSRDALLSFGKIDYDQIRSVTIKRKNAVLRGAIFGAAIGLVIGAVGGYASGDDPETTFFGLTAGEKAIGAGAIGTVAGAAIGCVIGALAHKTFVIHGNKSKFTEMKTTVLERIYSK